MDTQQQRTLDLYSTSSASHSQMKFDQRIQSQALRHGQTFDDGYDEGDDDIYNMAARRGEETASVIGVSISQAQTRLKSPTTPAIEKIAAINPQGGFFDDRIPSANIEQHQQAPMSDRTTILGQPPKPQAEAASPSLMPSPWRAGPRTFQRSEDTNQLLGSMFRKRASSGPERKSRIPIQLPTLPKPRFFSNTNSLDDSLETTRSIVPEDISRIDGSVWSRESWNDFLGKTRSRVDNTGKPSPSDVSSTPVASPFGDQDTAFQMQGQTNRPSLGLRRATSDQSLYLIKTLSKASSLGDDSRFENVHEQINSRLKAIKDSWQDSNLRRNLPSLPKAISSSRLDLNEYSNGVRKSVAVSGTSDGRKTSAVVEPVGVRGNTVGATSANHSMHPSFTEALSTLTGDIVILGGYRGSILREAKPPHRQVWLPLLKAGLNFKKPDLGIGFEDDDEDRITESVIPGGMLTHIGPVDISRRLLKRLRNTEHAKEGRLRVHEYG